MPKEEHINLFLATNRAKYLHTVFSPDPLQPPASVWDFSNDPEGGSLNHFLTVTGSFEAGGNSFFAWAEYAAEQAYLDAFDAASGGVPASVTLFLHGFNVDFKGAVSGLQGLTASLAKAGYAGGVMGYDWPSAGGVLLYTHDRVNAEASVGPFFGFLSALQSTCKNRGLAFNVVCHSMGNVLAALAGKALMWQGGTKEPWVDQLVMLAPDLTHTLFDTGATGEISDPRGAGLQAMCKEIAILYSPSDGALNTSEHFEHPDDPRLGRLGPASTLPPGIVAVDASKSPCRVRKHGDYFLKKPLGFWAGLLK